MPTLSHPEPRFVHIHYLRPPDRLQIFRQELLHEEREVSVTFARGVERTSPVLIEGEVALEDGSDVVWFTFPERWHDIGRFHRADGTFTGIYANILIPCTFEPGGLWHTTDLFLDLWLPAADQEGRRILLLDETELEEAEECGWVTEETAIAARDEAQRLMRAFDAGVWPPAIVSEWTRERVLG